MSGVRLQTVARAEDGMRLDKWFGTHFPQVAFGQLQKFIRTGQIRVDSGRVKTNTRLEAGQVVRVPPVEQAIERAEVKTNSADAEFLRDLILYEDDDIYVFNKPHGPAEVLQRQSAGRLRERFEFRLSFRREELLKGAQERPTARQGRRDGEAVLFNVEVPELDR